MTEYRIVEAYRKIWIEKKLMSDTWIKVDIKDVPKYHDTVGDARSWVATIKRGVVYHDAEEQKEHLCEFNRALNGDCLICGSKDAPNLAQDERKAEDDTSDGIKPLEWFEERHMQKIVNTTYGYDFLNNDPRIPHDLQLTKGYRYSDPQ